MGQEEFTVAAALCRLTFNVLFQNHVCHVDIIKPNKFACLEVLVISLTVLHTQNARQYYIFAEMMKLAYIPSKVNDYLADERPEVCTVA
jgi:hypothetical protein